MIIENDDGSTVTFRNGKPKDDRPPRGELISVLALRVRESKQPQYKWFRLVTFICPCCGRKVAKRYRRLKTAEDGKSLIVGCPECHEECIL